MSNQSSNKGAGIGETIVVLLVIGAGYIGLKLLRD